MKKIAIATEGNEVSQHFGHCAEFTLYEVDDETVTFCETIVNDGYEHAQLPALLASKGASVIISGRMGKGAYQHFQEQQMEVVTGVSGLIHEVASQYGKGNLESKLVFCHHHDDTHTCSH